MALSTLQDSINTTKTTYYIFNTIQKKQFFFFFFFQSGGSFGGHHHSRSSHRLYPSHQPSSHPHLYSYSLSQTKIEQKQRILCLSSPHRKNHPNSQGIYIYMCVYARARKHIYYVFSFNLYIHTRAYRGNFYITYVKISGDLISYISF